MGIKLVFEPGKVVTWEEFRNYPRFSIAIDGYCSGRTRSSDFGRRLNINHHEGVDRLSTRSSCDQALVDVQVGLYDTFQKDGEPEATVYANDCDPDVAFATYILMHPGHADRPKLKQLVRVEDLLDMSAGLFPMNKKGHLIRQLAWITKPYFKARSEGRVQDLDADGMRDLVEKMHRRIKDALFGRVKEIKLDTHFEVMADHDGWCMVREIGLQARLGLAEKGVKAFVSLICEKDDGTFHYSLVRRSSFIPFPLRLLYKVLNEAEGIVEDATDRWGGSDTCGGSPRIAGSRLSPAQLTEVISSCLKAQDARQSCREK